jgi:hypothetical protein
MIHTAETPLRCRGRAERSAMKRLRVIFHTLGARDPNRSAPRAFMVSEPWARPMSGRLGASRRDDRDPPLILSTPPLCVERVSRRMSMG